MLPVECAHCGAENAPEHFGRFCTCGREIAEPTAAGPTRGPLPNAVGRLRLWNPDAARFLSLALSPAFGAYLHAANWRALGKPERARTNVVWLWTVVAFASLNLAALFLPKNDAVPQIARWGALGLAMGWYFTQGRSQSRYVKETVGNDYVERGWGLPLLAGVAVAGSYYALAISLWVHVDRPDPSELAADLTPLILKKLREQPGLEDLSVENVTLVHESGDRYTGFADIGRGGQSERFALVVAFDADAIKWQLKPLAGK